MVDSVVDLAKLLLTGLLLTVLPAGAVANSVSDALMDCASIAGSFERLDCYDALAREEGGMQSGTGAAAAGQWRVQHRSSGISDDVDVYLIMRAVEEIPGDEGEVRPVLVVRCEKNNTAVIFNFARFIQKSRADAAIRIDDGAVLTARLKMSASGKALGFWRGEDAVPFARRLLDGKRLLIQVTPLGARPVLAEFPLEGFETASAPLREACGW